MKKKIINNMKLNEQIDKIKRLLNNSTVFPEKKENIQEQTGPIFDMAMFLEKLAIKFVPIENKVARVIISDLEHQRINGLEFDAGKGVIKSINPSNLNDLQLAELFRIPQIREALEEMAKEYRPRGPQGPVVAFNLNNSSLPTLFPNSVPGRMIRAYKASTGKIANVDGIIKKYIKIPFNKWINKYWVGGQIKTYFIDKIKYNIFLRGVKDSLNETKYAKFYQEMYDKASKISSDYLQAMETKGRVDYTIYQEQLKNLLKEFKLMRNNVKKTVFNEMKKTMPEKVVKELDDAAGSNVNDDDFLTMWGELKKISSDVVTEEEKYTFYFTGIIRIATDIGNWRFMDATKRIFNFMIRYDARLQREIVDNVKSKGRYGWLWREAFVRTLVVAGYYGLIDYAEAFYKNKNGKAFTWPDWMPEYLGWAGVDADPFEPDFEWGNKLEPETGKTLKNGIPYIFIHIGKEMWKVGSEHPFMSLAKTGPLTAWIVDKLSDPNEQNQKEFIETELYKTEKENLLKKIKSNPEYVNANPQEQEKMITDSLNVFEENINILRETRATNEKLNDK